MLTLFSTYLRLKWGGFRDRAALDAWQSRLVERHLAAILPHSPFYQQHYAGHPLEKWQTLPIIDKAIMMENFSALNTVGITRDEAFEVALAGEKSRDFSPTVNGITVGLSSGTSGNRGLFLASKQEREWWAGAALAKIFSHSFLSNQRVAFFLRANSNLYETVEFGPIRFKFFDLLDRPEEHVRQLNAYQPTYLIGPPSLLRYLADAQEDGLLKIKPLKIVSVAETLDPIDKAAIRRAFQQIVHQVYQCTEGFLASTCQYGTLHLHEDIVVIQKERLPDDPDGRRFVPIITDFSRRSQPILRYRLDDVLVERAEPCPCGSVMTAIEMIEGRCDDQFFLPTQTGEMVPIYPDYIRRSIISASEHITSYTAVQTSPHEVEISLRLKPCGADFHLVVSQVEASLCDLFKFLRVQAPVLRFKALPAETPSIHKRRRVMRRW